MKRKRDGWGIFYAYMWTVAMLVWITVGIYLLVTQPVDIGGILLWVLVSAIPAMGMLCLVPYEDHIRTVEFIVYEYELWTKKSQDYEKRYIVIDKCLRAKFTYNFHVKDYEAVMTDKEVDEYIKGMGDSLMGWTGYETEEAAMQEIIERIKSMVANAKDEANIRVRNIKTHSTYTVEELKAKMEAGEFKEKK